MAHDGVDHSASTDLDGQPEQGHEQHQRQQRGKSAQRGHPLAECDTVRVIAEPVDVAKPGGVIGFIPRRIGPFTGLISLVLGMFDGLLAGRLRRFAAAGAGN